MDDSPEIVARISSDTERRIRALTDDRLLAAVLDCSQRLSAKYVHPAVGPVCAIVRDEHERRGVNIGQPDAP